MDVTAKDRVLSARGLDVLVAQLEKVQIQMSELTDARELDAATSGTDGSKSSSPASVVTPPNPRRPGSVPTSACPTGCWPDDEHASGGQRRRVELARILFGARAEDGSSTG